MRSAVEMFLSNKKNVFEEIENEVAATKSDAKQKVESPKVESLKVESPKNEKEVKQTNTQKELKPWEKVVNDGPKTKIVNTITFFGEQVEYSPGMKHRYKFTSLRDGLNRVVTGRFPKSNRPDGVEEITYMGYDLRIEKYGSSIVCKLSKDGKVILNYVSLATVIDVLQDLLNPGETCELTWGTIDQSIKLKRGLKSRIKQLDKNDFPVGRRKNQVKEEKKEEKVQ